MLATASYDPYGGIQGSALGSFGFTGELQQGTAVYLRARWYDAGRGRFTGRDPFTGWGEQPYSLHPYQYGYADPVMYADSTGRFACATAITTVGWLGNSSPTLDPVQEYAGYCLNSYRRTDTWVHTKGLTHALGVLISLFSANDFPGGDSAGATARRVTALSTAAERLEFVLDYTATGLRPTQFGKLFNDSGFGVLCRDPFPPPNNNQVGHFLTAAGFGYEPAASVQAWQTQLGLSRTQIRAYSDAEAAIRLIVGHEKVADVEGSPGDKYDITKAQFESANAGDVSLFLAAVAADADDNSDLRECLIRTILPNIPEEGLATRPGNSLQDMRLSIKGWRFGQMIRNREITTTAAAATWLSRNLR